MNKDKATAIGVIAVVAIFVFLLLGAGVQESIDTQFVDDYGTDYGIALSLDFEEGTGATTFDQSPYGNDGTITGASWASGIYGEALTFDGNDYVTVSDSSSLDVSSEITIEAWAKDPPIPFGAALGGDFEIIGDAVVVNDSRTYLSAEPHTIASSGWVEFTLISKQYSGDIDVVWGFNQTVSRPKNPQIWANYTHTLWRWIEVEKTYFNETTLEFVNYTRYEKEYYDSTFYDWKDINLDFTKKTKDAKGMDTWYILKKVSVEKGKVYKLRCWVEIPFAGNDIIQGKYAWGVKLSSDTIQEAIDNDRFYFIDPWYNSAWLYRLKITIDSGDVDAALTNFPILVYLDSTRITWTYVQDDLDDIRFTSDDEVTLLDYDLESYTANDEAWLWVRLPTISNTIDTDFYLYYGNTGASSGEDKTGTWDDDFVMVQHMVDETTSTILDSTQYDSDGTKKGANEPIETASGMIDSAQDFDGTDDYIDHGQPAVMVGPIDAVTLELWINPATTQTSISEIIGIDGTYAAYMSGARATSFWTWNTNDTWVQSPTYTLPGDTQTYLVCRYDKDGGVNNQRIYINGTLEKQTNQTLALRYYNRNFRLGRYGNFGLYTKGILDEARVSNTSRSDAWIKASFESERDDLLTFGRETAYKIIVEKFDSYLLGISGTDTLIGQINTTRVTYTIESVTSWHYYGLSYNGSNLRLLIDGAEVNTTACTGSIAVNDFDVFIGQRFLGPIDQVRIYNVDKTVAEIKNHYLNSGHMYSGSVIVSDDFRILNTSLGEEIGLDEDGLDLNLNYVLYSPFESWLHVDFAAGGTNVELSSIPAGFHHQDRRYSSLHVSVGTAPGVGKWVNVTLTDGTSSMIVSITGAAKSENTDVGAFDLDVSAESLTLSYSQTAGGASDEAGVIIHWHYKENE